MKRLGPLLIGLLLFAGMSVPAQACSVCFGAKGDPVTEAAGISIMFLFVFVMVILSGIIGFFWTIFKRTSDHQNLVNALGYDPDNLVDPQS